MIIKLMRMMLLLFNLDELQDWNRSIKAILSQLESNQNNLKRVRIIYSIQSRPMEFEPRNSSFHQDQSITFCLI